MTTVNVQQAKTQLSDLLARSERGEEIIIARAGRPIVRLVPVTEVPRRTFGGAPINIAENFDGPLPVDELSAWE